MVVEVVMGLYSRSLALLADAGHMLGDSAALALALIAQRWAAAAPPFEAAAQRRPPPLQHHRHRPARRVSSP
jgi:hypothetical protein